MQDLGGGQAGFVEIFAEQPPHGGEALGTEKVFLGGAIGGAFDRHDANVAHRLDHAHFLEHEFFRVFAIGAFP